VGNCNRAVGGGGGIRTHEYLTALLVFETSSFNHSDTPPITLLAKCYSVWIYTRNWPIGQTNYPLHIVMPGLQPLIPVIEIPSMNVFCVKKNSTMIGSATRVLAAIK
jgi:hypothetical protein